MFLPMQLLTRKILLFNRKLYGLMKADLKNLCQSSHCSLICKSEEKPIKVVLQKFSIRLCLRPQIQIPLHSIPVFGIHLYLIPAIRFIRFPSPINC